MINKTNYIGPSSYELPLRNVTSLPRIVWAQVASPIRCSGLGSSIVRMFPATVTGTFFTSMSP